MLSPNHNLHEQENNHEILYLFEMLTPAKRTREYKKDETIISIGEISNKFVFVQKGILRTFQIDEKSEEITSGFTFPGDFDIVAYSFFSRHSSREAIVALTDCSLDEYFYDDIIDILADDPKISKLVFSLLSLYIETLEIRLYEMRNKNAAQRYQTLKVNHPLHVAQIPDYLIASYLGISKEQMSRIKNNK
ncbi:MAG: Crp/Fnr family transcriptional regulator [Bacteroidota bacterium]